MSWTYRAGWTPAFDDVGLCPLPTRAYLETCHPQGRVDFRGQRLRGYVKLPAECARPGDGGSERWLLVSTHVLSPPIAECECAPVGCCQPPPRSVLFAQRIPEVDGVLRFNQVLPFAAGDQVSLQRIEVRGDGDCVMPTATDPASGAQFSVELGPRLAVAGARILAVPGSTPP